MTLTTADQFAPQRPALARMLRSERIKLMSTNTWWIIGLVITAATIAALAYNLFLADADLPNALTATTAPQDAADVMTSGQFAGGLFVMLLAILMITNEFHHQTATATFLATPQRTTVVVGKFVTALTLAVTVWAGTTAINYATAFVFYHAKGASPLLSSGLVGRAVAVNLMIYVLWAAFGVGIGALIRSQLGATITAIMVYTVGSYAIEAVAYLVYLAIWHSKVVYDAIILIPGFAGQVAAAPTTTTFEGVSFSWWQGVVVMVAYGIAATVIGTWILRKRDIS